MAVVVGKVQNIENGKFFIKDENEQVKELKNGDFIYENYTVFGDDKNSKSSKIEIKLDSNDVIVLNQGEEQILDSSLVETAFGNEELYFTKSDFLENFFAQEQEPENNDDVTEEETTLGEEEVEDEQQGSANFQARDGNIVDVISDLRKARSQSFEDRELFQTESEQRLAFQENDTLNAYNSNDTTISNPPQRPTSTPTPPEEPTDTPDDDTQPTQNSSTIIAQMSISDASAYEHEGVIIFDVTLDRALFSDVTFTYTLNGITATKDEDFENSSSTITIPSGTTNMQIKVPITEDYIHENSETFTITINTPTGDVNLTKATATGTIIDSTEDSNKTYVNIKLFAADENGNVLKDSSGNYKTSSDVLEENDAYYIAYAFEDGQTVFNDSTKLKYQQGTVDIEFTDGTATGGSDFANSEKTITLGVATNIKTLSDSTAEGIEDFQVSIKDNSYAGGYYEGVKIDTQKVNTNISDQKIFVKIVSIDNEVTEGNNLEYKLIIVNENGEPVNVPASKSITVNLSYTGATTDINSTTSVTITGGNSEKTFLVTAIDDFYAEGNENINIEIDSITDTNNSFKNIYSHSLANGATSDLHTVDGTIQDNTATNSTLANPSTIVEGSYGEEDSVYLKLTGPDTIYESETREYKIELLDKDGNAIKVTQALTVTVTFENIQAENADYDKVHNETLDVIINPNSSSNTFDVKAILDGLSEYNSVTDKENFKVSITGINAQTEFENVVIGDKDGNFKSVTTEIQDLLSLNTPDTAYIDESNFSSSTSTLTGTKLDNGGSSDADGNSSSGAITKLNVSASSSYTGYEILFDETVKPNLTSSGTALEYDFSTPSKVIAYLSGGNSTDDKIFEITLNKNAPGGADDSYTYQQFKTLDHPVNPDDDTINFNFGFKIKHEDNSLSDTENINVTVNDATPLNGDINKTINEDNTGETIWLSSSEGFKDGKVTISGTEVLRGETKYLDSDGNIVSENTTEIGALVNNGDGSITFTPKENYSGTPGFSYSVTDNDGDTTNGNINFTVTPMADGVNLEANKTIYKNEDEDKNNNEKPIKLGLILPTVKDGTDLTVGDEDAPERIGLINIDLRSIDPSASGYKIMVDSNGDGTADKQLIEFTNKPGAFPGAEMYIYIKDNLSDTEASNIHLNDLYVSGDGFIGITKEMYESISILPSPNNATNFPINVKVTSHEVDDSGNKYSPDIKSTEHKQTITIDVQAITDKVGLSLDDAGSSDIAVAIDKKSASIVMDEDTTLDLQNILKEVLVDLDGSETHSYEISGLPIGTKIYIGSNSPYTVTSASPITRSFSSSEDDPIFKITPPSNFSGNIENITITLKSTDSEPYKYSHAPSAGREDHIDTGTTTASGFVGADIQEENDSITLNIYVNPIADNVTLPDVSTIEDTAVKLFANIALTDTGTGTESITHIKILTLQNGWVLKDNNGTPILTGDGSNEITIDVISAGGIANVKDYTITPPGHSSSDITLNLEITTKDTNSVKDKNDSDTNPENSKTFTHTQKITVTPKAESVDSDSDGTNGNDVTFTAGHTYNLTSNFTYEDGDKKGYEDQANPTSEVHWFNLGTDGGFNLSDGWTNEDSSSEKTFAHLKFTIDQNGDGVYNTNSFTYESGAKYRYHDGSNYVEKTDTGSGVDIPLDYLDSLEIIAPPQLSGDARIEVQAKTVDYDEDTNSASTAELSSTKTYLDFVVKPVADDATVSIRQSTGNEDAGRKADGSIDTTSAANGIDLYVDVTSDDKDGSETYTITLKDIPDGAYIFYDHDNDGTGEIFNFDTLGNSISTNGSADSTGQFTGNNYQITPIDGTSGTWELKIENFKNNAGFKIIPPLHTNEDINLKVLAHGVDGEDTGENSTTLDINVKLKGVADGVDGALSDSDKNTAAGEDVDGNSNSYNFIAHEEDTVQTIKLNSLFTNGELTLQSKDTDGSESIFITIENLTSGIEIINSAKFGGTYLTQLTKNSNGKYSFDDSVELKVPANFAGEIEFDIKARTIENDGDKSNSSNPISLSVFVTPDAEGYITGSSIQEEDKDKILNFSFVAVDSGEELKSFFIDTETLPDGVEFITTNHGTLTKTSAGSPQWVELDVTNSVIENVTARFTPGSQFADVSNADGNSSIGKYQFNYRYSVSDTATDADGNTYTDYSNDGAIYDDTVSYRQGTYNVTISAVTDSATTKITAPIVSDPSHASILGDNSSGYTVTVNKTGASFEIPITITPNDDTNEPTNGSTNGADDDGSEKIETIVITGVPEGIEVVNGTQTTTHTVKLDNSGNPYVEVNNTWELNISDNVLDFNGATNTIEFKVTGEHVNINSVNTGEITVTVTHKDGSATSSSSTDKFDITVSNSFNKDTNEYQNETGHVWDIALSAKNDINLEEDKVFYLSELIEVQDGATTNDQGGLAIILSEIPAGYDVYHNNSLISGQNINGKTYYTINSTNLTNDANTIRAYLSKIKIDPKNHENTLDKENVDFDIEIVTYLSEITGQKNSYKINGNPSEGGFDAKLDPVSDATTVSISGNSSLNKNGSEDYVISLTNNPDNPTGNERAVIIDGKVYLQLSDGGSNNSIKGEFELINGDPNDELADYKQTIGTNTIGDDNNNYLAAGEYYVFNVADFNSNITIRYTAPQGEEYNNSVSIKAYVITKEDASAQGYTTKTILSSGNKIISVEDEPAPIIPVPEPSETGITPFPPTALGDEDGIARLDLAAGATVIANTELDQLIISGVPFGYEVYNDSTLLQGVIAGVTSDGDFLYKYTINLSSNPATAMSEIEKIGFKNVINENFGGILDGLTLSIKSHSTVDSGLTTQTQNNFKVQFAPVADPLLNMNATKTFGNEYEWVDINLNINVKDNDGSETIQVQINASSGSEALDDSAIFRYSDGTIINNTSFNSATKTWTISGIEHDKINDLQMMYHEYDGNVDVVVKTVDSSHGLSSTLDDANDSEGSFNVRIEAKTTITTGNENNSILYNTNDQIDAGAGFDRIILDTGSTIDFNKINNIEAIDLSKDSFDLTQVTLTNVLDLVDGTNKELKIFGDSDDSISFRNITSGSYSSRNTWSKDSNTIEEDGKTFEVYRNSLDSDVVVKVEQVISDSII